MSRKRQPPVPLEEKEPEGAAESVPDDHYLPPRKTVHPTEKEKWVFVFYRTLLWIFICLVMGLLIWGWWRLLND